MNEPVFTPDEFSRALSVHREMQEADNAYRQAQRDMLALSTICLGDTDRKNSPSWRAVANAVGVAYHRKQAAYAAWREAELIEDNPTKAFALAEAVIASPK